MFLTIYKTGQPIEAFIENLAQDDYKVIEKTKRFPKFNWNLEKKNDVYKIRTLDSDEIKGLMSLSSYENEKWIKINLLESSKENVGNDKHYDRIAGCLIAYACRLSFIKGFHGCVALEPKTELIGHYFKKYNLKRFGIHLYTDLRNSEELIREYLR